MDAIQNKFSIDPDDLDENKTPGEDLSDTTDEDESFSEDEEDLEASDTDEDEDEAVGDGNLGRTSPDILQK